MSLQSEKQIIELSDQDLALVRKSYPYFSSVNLEVEDKDGQVVPFKFNRMQKRLWQLFVEDTKAKKPIRWLIIKARQLGCTTWISGLIYWLITMNYNRRGLILSYDEDSAREIGNKYQNFYIRSKPELCPKVRLMNRKLIHFATPLKDSKIDGIGLNSKLFVNTAGAIALGRSYTFHYVHASEYAYWDQVGINVDSQLEGINDSVPKKPNTLIIKETTAQGQNIAYEEWIDEYSTQRKIFISWIADEDYRIDLPWFVYPELSELPDSRYGDEIQERKDIINELKFWYPDESKQFSWLEHESMCRLAWRRYKIDEKKGDKHKFNKEFPSTPDKAFGTSSNSIFNVERLLEIKDWINRNNIQPQHYRYEQDNKVRPCTEVFYPAKYGHLRIYSLPKPGFNYVIGADGAQGIQTTTINKAGKAEIRKGDDSSFVILELSDLTEVASFNDILSPTDFAYILYYIGLYYNNSLLAVERNDKGGYAALELLVNTLYYPNLYYHVDPFKYKTTSEIKYGHVTNEVNRAIMIRDCMDLIESNKIIIQSPEILDQMHTFVQLPNGKIGGMPGKKDDLVMSLLIAVHISKQVHIRRSINSDKAPKYSLDWWSSQIQSKSSRPTRGRRL